MQKKITASVVAGIALLGASHPALAHHGRASYDATRVFTIMGTVSDFQFSNPHVELFLDVKDDKGNIEKWIGEGTSPNMLVREGWSRRTIKPGDQITATGHPARNGANTMRIDKIVLPNGKELTFEGPGGT
jgi:DNA/RNA endonuclease YhcR with UshA esterase domain